MTEGLSPTERIVASYKLLAASAEVLRAASDEFAKPITDLDGTLQQLNLGLTTWVRIQGCDADEHDNYWSRDVGYGKVGGKWGLAIRTTSGNHNHDQGNVEEWLFNDAPRSFRIDAIDKVPDLVEKLIKASDKTARKLKEKAVEARELATALSRAAEELKPQRKERAK